jgi:GNAT superfamily N-acetyltransferase
MIKLRKFRKEDTEVVALLVMNTYKQFNSQEFIKKSAVQEYLNYYDPAKNTIQQLYENFLRTPIFYVAVENNKIIGMIRGGPGRIINLFVDGKQHKKGVGRLLVSKFESEAKKQKSHEIKIRASLYAIPFYQKMGYKKTTGIRNFHGLKVYPMKKVLK